MDEKNKKRISFLLKCRFFINFLKQLFDSIVCQIIDSTVNLKKVKISNIIFKTHSQRELMFQFKVPTVSLNASIARAN